MAARHLIDGSHGGFVVGIHAGENVVGPVSDGCQVSFEHALDHAVFMPQGHKDGYPALRSLTNSDAAGHGNRLRPERINAMLINRSSSPLSSIHTAKGTRHAATHLSSHTICEN